MVMLAMIDYIAGNKGNNQLSGGLGDDKFFISINANKTDIITDFELGNNNERIVLTQFTKIYSFEDLNITQVGNDTVIHFENGQSLILNSVNYSSLSNENFIFYGEILGDDQNNELHGTRLEDIISAGNGDDDIFGGENDDYISGGAGDDGLLGEHGNDYIMGGSGNDVLIGGIGDDVLDGGEGDDILTGDEGDDKIYGGAGDDLLYSSVGSETLSGGTGSDAFIIEKAPGSQTIISDFEVNNLFEQIDFTLFEGITSLNISQVGSDAVINLPDNQKVIIKNVNNNTLTSANFIFSGQDISYNEIDGTTGVDIINGFDDQDIINGFDGDDWLHGGDSDDVIYGGAGDDHIYGDGVRGEISLDVILTDTQIGNDRLYGGDGDDVLLGFKGNDYLDGDQGDNILSGGEGFDTFAIKYKVPYRLGGVGLQSPSDNILDFDVNDINEKIDISDIILNSNGKVTKFSDLQITQGEFGTIIAFPQPLPGYLSQVILLQGVNASDITENNFIGFSKKPILADDTATTTGINSVAINILSNDHTSSGGDIDPSNVKVYQPANGTITFNTSTGIVNYTPNAGFYGQDSFLYTVKDSSGAISSAVVSIDVIKNSSPVVSFINASTAEDSSINIAIPAISDAEDGVITPNINNIIFDGVRAGASVSLNANGTIKYQPLHDFFGIDSFTYQVIDSKGGKSIAAKVTVNVSPVNDAPTANVTSITRESTETIIDVLAGASDADGDTLAISSITSPSRGTAEIVDGKIVYSYTGSFFAGDSFKYTISDGHGGSVTKTLNIIGDFVSTTSGQDFIGTDGNDQILARYSGDKVYASNGDDIINVSGGFAYIDGGKGNDTITVNSHGFSNIYAIEKNAGDVDTIVNIGTYDSIKLTGFASDSLKDFTKIQDGNDVVVDLGDGQKLVITETTIDAVNSLYNYKEILLGENNGHVFDGSTKDELFQGFGNRGINIFNLGAGDDLVLGGKSGDVVVVEKLAGDHDTVVYSNSGIYADSNPIIELRGFNFSSMSDLNFITSNKPNSTIIDLGDGQTLTIQGITQDKLKASYFIGIEDVVFGTNGDDILNNQYMYNQHTDAINGLDGNDTIYGNSNTNLLDGGAGDDILNSSYYGDADFVVIKGGFGSDEFIIRDSGRIEDFDVSNPNEKINFSFNRDITAFNQLNITQYGNDTIIVTPFSVYGLITLVLKNVSSSQLTANNFIFHSLEGTGGDDSILGGTNGNILNGYAGNDILDGYTGDDKLNGGDGNDTLLFGQGNDTLTGGAGSDTFKLTSGFDTYSTQLATITDFDVNDPNEKIDLSAIDGTVRKFEEIRFIASGSDTKIYTNPNSNQYILVKNTTPANFTQDNVVGITDKQAILEGTEENDTLYASSNDNYTIVGKGGDDTLVSNNGYDILTGGTGNDIFKFATGFGHDTITDFEAGNPDEKIYLPEIANVYKFSDLNISQDGNDTVINISSSNTIRLENVIKEQLISENFVLTTSIYGTDSNDTILDAGDANNVIRPTNIIHNNFHGTNAATTSYTYFSGASIANSGGNTYFTVSNFSVATSVYQLIQLGVSDFSQLVMNQVGNDTVISLPDGYRFITLQNVIKTDLTASNFMFVPSNSDWNNNMIYVHGGDDTVQGGAGSDTIYGGEGNDSLYGGLGDDYLKGENGNDILYANAGNDSIDWGAGINQVYGGDGDDNLTNYTASSGNIISGDAGNDEIYARGDNNTISGGDGDDNITSSGNNVSIDAGEGNNYIESTNGSAQVIAGDGDDTIFSSNANNTIDAGAGSDYINVGGYWALPLITDPELIGTTVHAGSGNDIIEVIDEANNTIYGDSGYDSINIWSNNNAIYGGSDADIFAFQTLANSVNTIEDFDIANVNEKIDVQFIEGINTFADLNFTQNGADTVINLPDNQSIILKNITASELTANNFVFKLLGSDKDGWLIGNYGDDYILGGSGDEIIYGVSSHDILGGGAGKDIFVIPTESSQVINDFNTADDIINFGHFADIKDFSDLNIKYSDFDNSVSIFYGSDAFTPPILRLNNVSENSLTVANFSFDLLNTPPVVRNNISGQYAIVNGQFNFTVSPDTFAEYDGELLTYAATLENGAPLPSWLVFDNSNMTFSGTPSFADNGDIKIILTASDGKAQAALSFDVRVLFDGNASIIIDNLKVDENQAGAIVGNLTVTNFDLGNGFAYTVSDSRFEVVNGQLKLKDNVSLNYEDENHLYRSALGLDDLPINLTVQAVNSQGISVIQNFDIVVNNVNEAPTDIILWNDINGEVLIYENNLSIDENIAIGTTIAKLSVFDDSTETGYSYELDGVNASLFEIVKVGDLYELRTKAVINFEATPSELITIKVIDSGNLTFTKELNIEINSVTNVITGSGTITGTDGNDEIFGSIDSDLLSGGAGNDILHYTGDEIWPTEFVAWNVGSPDNKISGETVLINPSFRSFDAFDGGAGYDKIVLSDEGDGIFLDDMYSANPLGQNIARLTGVEEINAGGGNDIVDLTSHQFAYGDIKISGGTGNDVLWSSSGNDILRGDAGNDLLNGGSGNDVLNGGADEDILLGGLGSDVFKFDSLFDSTNSAYDTITDFTVGQDKIDLAALHTFGINSFSDLVITRTYYDEIIITTNDSANPEVTNYFELHLKGIAILQDDDFIWGQ
ncbi:MAG: calcium binding hemolysin protein [Rickettsiaceae bacterium]|nr:calcium binding hemolysin protein [Rickettsiaceae bacterium]